MADDDRPSIVEAAGLMPELALNAWRVKHPDATVKEIRAFIDGLKAGALAMSQIAEETLLQPPEV